jgi:predicted GNAT family acetyltransferase
MPTTDIIFTRKLIADGHGADDYESDVGDAYTLTATSNGETVGTLDYNDTGEVVRIRWCEVAAAHRRQGIASALHHELVRLHPQSQMTTGGITDDGEFLLAALSEHHIVVFEEPDPNC